MAEETSTKKRKPQSKKIAEPNIAPESPRKMFAELTKSIVSHDHTNLAAVPDNLYHYTNALGAQGIIETSSIWATDSRFLNDSKELTYAEDLAKDIITSMSASPRYKTSSEFFSRCLQDIGSRNTATASFLFCLSEEADSLSQWRGYAREGRGFTIGFDGKELCKSATAQKRNFGIRKVEYRTDVQTKTISLILDQVDTQLSKFDDKAAVAAASDVISMEIYLLSYYYKHRSFRDEKEWRLVSVVDKRETKYGKTGLNVRCRGDELVPYITFRPRSDLEVYKDRLMISKIGIGPGFVHGNQGIAVQQLLENNSYKSSTYFADTPFRQL